MKKNLRMLIVCAAFGIIVSCAAKNYAQTGAVEPMVGGYNSAAATDAEVRAAANFAVKKQAKKQRAKIKLSAIGKAEQQIVAGRNYRLCLQIEVLEKGKKIAVPQTIQTVVFLNLRQKYELTSWAVAACADEMPPVTPNL